MIKGTKITAVTWPYLSSLFALKITREIINYSTYGFFLMIRAGLPAITTLSPNDFVTTLPAPVGYYAGKQTANGVRHDGF